VIEISSQNGSIHTHRSSDGHLDRKNLLNMNLQNSFADMTLLRNTASDTSKFKGDESIEGEILDLGLKNIPL
jgi:hypothetical protein